MYNINMGGLFSSNYYAEDNTLNTADFATEKEDKITGGAVSKELNNNIMSILHTEVQQGGYSKRNEYSDNNINGKIANILNSVSELNGGNRYLKYDIFNVIEQIEKGKKGGSKMESSEINFSESSDVDFKSKISNIIKGGNNINNDLVKEVLKEELNQTGGDCSCEKKEQKGGYYSSSSSSSTSTTSSSSDFSDDSSSSSSDEEFKKQYSNEYEYKYETSDLKDKKKVKKGKKTNSIKKSKTNKKSKKSKTNKKYGGDSTSNNSNSDYKNSESIGKGISIFPFNSSSIIQSSVSEKNFRILRRHI